MKTLTINGPLAIATPQLGAYAPPTAVTVMDTPTKAEFIRDMAKAAMIGLLSQRSSIIHNSQEVAKAAFDMADAMLEEHNQRSSSINAGTEIYS